MLVLLPTLPRLCFSEHPTPVGRRQACAHIRESGPQVAGLGFWAWGGEGRPRQPKAVWAAGDDWTGDPPHAFQGVHSIYDEDESTMEVIRECSRLMAGGEPEEPEEPRDEEYEEE